MNATAARSSRYEHYDPCTIGDGHHYVVTESDGVRVCQKCGQVMARVRELTP